ncbi:hypothetical protein L0337_08330 [candidate division KSB1 bacterium]|nr:hypothetical protein [candidate division KSB1 bacterium]
MSTKEESKLAVFEGKRIRKVFHEGEWWFSIIDVIDILVGGDRPRKYWNDLKNKLIAEGYNEVSEKIGQLKRVFANIMQCFASIFNAGIRHENGGHIYE